MSKLLTVSMVKAAGAWKDTAADGTEFVWVGQNLEGTGYTVRKESTIQGLLWSEDFDTAIEAAESVKHLGRDSWTEGYPS